MAAQNPIMRKAKMVLILSAPVIYALIVLSIYKLNSDEKKLLTLQFDKIQMGMEISGVKTLLGQPDYDSSCKGETLGYYSSDYKEEWRIDFNPSGKVTGKKHIFTTPEDFIGPRDTYYNRLLRKASRKAYLIACG
jgi:hypothetical protein